MFMGSIDGLVSFDPRSISKESFIPPIVMTDFRLFNTSVVPGSDLNGRVVFHEDINSINRLNLTHRDRVFEFEFAALHFSAPQKNKYTYIMEGFEDTWNYVGNRNFASYTNLPPGDYIFRVRGSNCDGVWNEEGISLPIRIIPPFWETGLLKISIILLGIFLLLSLYQFRTRTMRLRSEQLQEINAELEKQILERQKAERELMGAHQKLEQRVKERTVELANSNKILRKEITERQRAEKEAERRAVLTTLIYQVGKRVSSELNREKLLQEIVEAVQDAFDYYGVLLFLVHDKKNKLDLASVAGYYSKYFSGAFAIPFKKGIIGKVAVGRKTSYGV